MWNEIQKWNLNKRKMTMNKTSYNKCLCITFRGCVRNSHCIYYFFRIVLIFYRIINLKIWLFESNHHVHDNFINHWYFEDYYTFRSFSTSLNVYLCICLCLCFADEIFWFWNVHDRNYKISFDFFFSNK